jgi:acyl transferase domain-containing protein/glutamate-1-semialdehyde aminotransferase
MEPIAIIGLACRFPAAPDSETFWRMLREGVCAIGRLPTDRSDASCDSELADSNVSAGSIDLDRFDADLFGIPIWEASRLDPQQRLLLEVGWEALESAGYSPDALAGSQTGIFVGAAPGDDDRFRYTDASSVDRHSVTATGAGSAAGRLAHALDLHGPALAVDTACSSSLVALHLACGSLRQRECGLALVAGVDVISSARVLLPYARAHMLSADGRCKAFDRSADGTVRGEGCGVVVLKLLSDAIRDRDCILAVVRGSAVNHNGRGRGFTAADAAAQAAVIRKAWQDAGISAGDIRYVEAHGTGVPAADLAELTALSSVLAEVTSSDDARVCAIGSVKTNIGHLGRAAGMAGLIKTVLAIRHDIIPPHLNLRDPQPQLARANLLSVPHEPGDWPGEGRHVAGVNAFGLTGTNAHVVLDDAPPRPPSSDVEDRSTHVLCLSARTAAGLEQLAERYEQQLSATPEQPLGDLCFTAYTGRPHFSHRLAVGARTPAELTDKLATFVAGRNTPGVHVGRAQNRAPRRVAFLFTGQGSHYADMAIELHKSCRIFKDALERCHEALRSRGWPPLLDLLYHPTRTPHSLNETAYAQPALFALEYALACVWCSWGIMPAAVLGHSLGEYVAACVAGVIELEPALALIAERARLMDGSAPGEMYVVFADEASVAPVLVPYSDSASIAALNGPMNTVISGAPGPIRAAVAALIAKRIEVRRLNINRAFHSPLMRPIASAFSQAADGITFAPPRIPLIANVTGQFWPRDTAPDVGYWTRHMVEPTRFAAGVATLEQSGCDVLLEIGPQPVLIGMAQACVRRASTLRLPSLRRGSSAWQTMLDSLGALYVNDVALDWAGFDRDYLRYRVSVPTHPAEWQQCHTPTLRFLPPHTRLSENAAKDQNVSPALPEAMLMAPNRQLVILDLLRSMIARLLDIGPDEIDVDRQFLEMGLDSIVLVEAVRTVEDRFATTLPIAEIFEEASSLRKLAAYLDRTLPAGWSPKPDPPTASNDIPSAPIADQRISHPEAGAGDQVATPVSELAADAGTLRAGVEVILTRQLEVFAQLMSEQMDVLRAATASSGANGPDSQARHAAPIEPGGACIARESDPNRSSAADRAAFASDEGSTAGEFSPLVARYVNRTQQSKTYATTYRTCLADPRRSAGFRPRCKEIVYPIVGERALGAHMWDIDGNQYVDLTMGFGSLLFGHNAPFIVAAVQEELTRGFAIGPNARLAGPVAQLICELTGVERVTFCSSGTDAVMTALRLARTRTRRNKIAIFEGSYHGTFDGVLARSTTRGEVPRSTPLCPGVPFGAISDVLVLEYGTPSSLDALRAHAHELAAVLVEPVQARRPDLQPAEYLRELRTLTAGSGTALIFDEVLTGFRIHPRGCQDLFGVTADIVTYGKILGGGLPIGVVAGTSAWMGGIDGGPWEYGDNSYPREERTAFAGTFCKHPLSMAAAHAVLHRLRTEGPALQDELNRRTAELAQALNSVFEQEDVAIRAVHCGSLFRFTARNNLDVFHYHLVEHGIYVFENKHCFLSTSHSADDIRMIVDAATASVRCMRASGFFPPRHLPPPICLTTGDDEQHSVTREVIDIWREILDVEYVARDADFFGLGGNALKAEQLLLRVAAQFDIDLPMSVFCAAPTVNAMIESIAQAHADNTDPEELARIMDDLDITPASANAS